MTKNYLQQRGKMKTWTYRRRIPVHVQPTFNNTNPVIVVGEPQALPDFTTTVYRQLPC
jgi:hypothetical protein